MESNWKDFTIKCLDVALDYFDTTSNSNRIEFLSEIIDYAHRVAKEMDTKKAETVQPVAKAISKAEETPMEAEKTPVKFVADLVSSAPKKYEKHTFEIGKTKGHSDKSLSGGFEGAIVYIGDRRGNGIQDSLAEVISVSDGKSRDNFKLLKTGESLNMNQYLTKFGVSANNYARVRFTENPKVSFWMIKNTHHDLIKNMDELRGFVK